MPMCRIRVVLTVMACLAGPVVAVGGPLAEGAAGATAPAVVISELMYDPASGSEREEFVELAVPGSAAVDVGGWCLSGVTACLPAGTRIAAGGYLVLARDASTFATVYGRAADATYTGSLSNSGEKVGLADASGAVVDAVSYRDRDPWPTTPDGGGPSLELRDPGADRTDPRDWAASVALSGATPGALNSVAATGLPPRITAVTATPSAPAAGAKVQVSATIEGATGTPVVRLVVDQQAAVTVPMTAAGATFTATLPAATAGSLLRYRVEAANSAGTATWPRGDDTMPNASLVVGDGVTSKVPVLRWFLPEADYKLITANPTVDVRRSATIAFGDTVIDGATVKLRGNASRTSRKPNWKIELPHNHALTPPGAQDAVDEFALQADWGDDSHGRAHLAWEAYRRAGVPAAVTFPVRVQRNGASQGLYSYSELYDGTWRDQHDLDKRPFYEASVYAWDATRQLIGYRYDKKSGDDGDYRDLQAFLAGIDLPDPTTGSDPTYAAQREALLATADLPELIEYAAVTALTQHVDSSNKNIYLTQDPTTQRWSVLPWDLDHTFGNLCCEVTSPFVTPAEPGDRTSELMQLLLADPQWRLMYFRRLRTLIDSVIPPGTLEATYDQVYGPAAPEAALDVPAWPRPWTTNYAWARTQLRTGIAARYAAIKADPRLPAAASATPVVTISEIKPGNGTEGFVELTNPSSAVTVDLSGWKVGGSVSAKLRPGTVLPPKGILVVAVSEPVLRGQQGSRMFVAASTGEVPPSSGTVTLTRADGSVADTVAYGGSGWPALPSHSSWELIDVRLNNAMASSWRRSRWVNGSPGEVNQQAPPAAASIGLRVADPVWNGDAARITWQVVAESGADQITGFQVYAGAVGADPADPDALPAPLLLPATARSAVVTGLRVGYGVQFAVVATTLAGPLGPSSPSAGVHWVQAPQVPGRPAVTGASVAAGSSGSPATATVTWTAPSSVGTSGVLAYRVTALQVASSASTAAVIGRSEAPVASGGARSVKLPLVPGTYRFVVEALNLTGWGPASTRSAAVVVP